MKKTRYILKASNKLFTAFALWEKSDGSWACIKTQPALEWMIGITPQAAKLQLANRALDYSWSVSVPYTPAGDMACFATLQDRQLPPPEALQQAA